MSALCTATDQIMLKLTSAALNGRGPVCGVEKLAREYEGDAKYPDADARVQALIRWETSKGFTGGFVTGMGGAITLPVTIPASLTTTWMLSMRLILTVARLYGHDPRCDRVQTLAFMVLAGDSLKEAGKRCGIEIAEKSARVAIRQIPREALTRINKAIGYRLLTKAGKTGLIRLNRLVPVVGGIVGGAFDSSACYCAGKAARKLFGRDVGLACSPS
ncbi:MAG: EcsC family protein [Desulfovibrionales bacterium]